MKDTSLSLSSQWQTRKILKSLTIVIKYNLKKLSKKEFENLSEKQKKFVHFHYEEIYLYSSPEKYVNHSSSPNTFQDLNRKCDIAIRYIKKGKEITTDSSKDDI